MTDKSIINKLPRFAYHYHKELKQIVKIVRGEEGYFKMEPRVIDNATNGRVIDKNASRYLNRKSNVTHAQYKAMIIGSMWGWHVPAVESELNDPKNCEERIDPRGEHE
jgi:hypothetical protein